MCAARPLDEAALTNNQTLAEWVGMSATKPTAAPQGSSIEVSKLVSPMQAFFAWAQVGPNDHYRSLASLTCQDWSVAASLLEVNGASPSLGMRGQVALFHATARRLCKLDPWPDALPPAQPTPAVQTPPQSTGQAAHGWRITFIR